MIHPAWSTSLGFQTQAEEPRPFHQESDMGFKSLVQEKKPEGKSAGNGESEAAAERTA